MGGRGRVGHRRVEHKSFLWSLFGIKHEDASKKESLLRMPPNEEEGIRQKPSSPGVESFLPNCV